MTRVDLDDRTFASVAKLLHKAAGLQFEEPRRESLCFSIGERMAATGMTDVLDYLALVGAPDGRTEMQALLDEVTIPETHFFRNPPQIRALRKHVLPELLRLAEHRKQLRIWSAGCSTGEEPYTVAMLIRELLPSGAGWDVKVIGTDVSTRALRAAAAARYAERAFVMTDPLDLGRWFTLDADDGAFTVRDEVRELVEFRHHNLVNDEPPFEPGTVDLILCRNVTIYFDRATTRALMKRLHGRLRDGGYLFLGHAETLWQISDDFSLVSLGDAFVYRRQDEAVTETRRAVLPDRRTENEPLPMLVERRQSAGDRRSPAAEARTAAVPRLPRLHTPAKPVPPVLAPVAAVPAAPQNPLNAVRAAVNIGRYDEAADLAEEVVAATPLVAEAHYLQGLALGNIGRDMEALVALRKAVYLDPDHGLAHFLLAGALDRRGERQAAARSYRAAASALAKRPVDGNAGELGGRSQGELVSLCGQLARQAEAHGGVA